MATEYKPGTVGFSHNASPRQQAAHEANGFAQAAKIRLALVIANWQGEPDQHNFNVAFANLAQAIMQLLPHVSEAIPALPGSPNGNAIEADVLEALRGITLNDE